MKNSTRPEIKSTDSVLDIIQTMAEGNPGALRVLGQVLGRDREAGIFDVLSLDDMNIRGTQIWVGFKDHCDQDLEKFVKCLRARDTKMVDAINAEGRRGNHREFAVTGQASFPNKRFVMG